MGRPKLPKGESKDIQIGVRLNSEEGKKLAEIAEDDGATPAEVVRKAAKAHLSNGPIWVKTSLPVKDMHGKKIRFTLYSSTNDFFEAQGEMMTREKSPDQKSITIRFTFSVSPYVAKITFYPLDQDFVDKIQKAPQGDTVDFIITK